MNCHEIVNQTLTCQRSQKGFRKEDFLCFKRQIQVLNDCIMQTVAPASPPDIIPPMVVIRSSER
jgi:hypothetical protein